MMTNSDPVLIDQIALQEFERTAIRRLIRKLDRRLLPYLLLIEIGSYINWISTGKCVRLQLFIDGNSFSGHAKLMNIEKALKLALCDIEWSISLFFLAYVSERHELMEYFSPNVLCFS